MRSHTGALSAITSERGIGKGGATSISKARAISGHISLHRNMSPLLMLNAWLAHLGSVAAQCVARARRLASVISISLSYAFGLPGKRKGSPSSLEIAAETAITIARFIGFPIA